MAALNNLFTIQDHCNDIWSSTLLTNKNFRAVSRIPVVNRQSTLLKNDGLSTSNKIELQKIRNFIELEENWDSYNAKKVSSVAIEKAQNLIKTLNKFNEGVYFSSPGPNGEVMVQLKRDSKEIEFVFYETSDKYVTFHNNDFSNQGVYSELILPGLIEWLNMHE